jgi:predicted amidophosphoribosyltransferase
MGPSGQGFLVSSGLQDQKQKLLGLGQRALNLLYPPVCMTCPTAVEAHAALCPACWRDTPFIFGTCCDLCGLPLPGAATGMDICDECQSTARPWEQGRAVVLYGDKARQILLGLKYYDRLDHVPMAANWMLRSAQPMLRADMLVTAVPLHWRRLVTRRYNQAAVLSAAVARGAGLAHCPDLLVRTRSTGSQDGRGRAGRFANVAGVFAPHPRRLSQLQDRHILLVDDVMTSGATLAAASEVMLAHGAASVRVLVLARVARPR